MTLHARRAFEAPFVRPLLAAALVLGTSALLTRTMTRRAEAANPPHGRFVFADGVRLHYTKRGSAANPPLVLLHGNGAMAREMELSGLVESAAEDFHVFVFDRPGYGHSDRPEGRRYTPEAQARLVLSAMSELGIESPLVLAHSWATMVACHMAIAEPAALRALVLVSGYYTPSLRLDTPLLGAPALPGIGTLMRHTVSPWLGRLMWPLMTRRVFAPGPVTEAFRTRYPVWMSLRPSQLLASAAEAAMMPIQAARLARRVARLDVPTMIVAGDKDRLVTTAWQSERLHERLPRARLRLVPGAGHMVHHTNTGDVMAAVREALDMSGARDTGHAVPRAPDAGERVA
jgi:pimeloyl-ACP methyl ester carboxylesterase